MNESQINVMFLSPHICHAFASLALLSLTIRWSIVSYHLMSYYTIITYVVCHFRHFALHAPITTLLSFPSCIPAPLRQLIIEFYLANLNIFMYVFIRMNHSYCMHPLPVLPITHCPSAIHPSLVRQLPYLHYVMICRVPLRHTVAHY